MTHKKPTSQHQTDHHEEGVEVPFEQLNSETLRNMIQEFVSRDGADWGDSGCTLDDKYEQVLKQLRNKKVKVVFDLKSQTVNIVANEPLSTHFKSTKA